MHFHINHGVIDIKLAAINNSGLVLSLLNDNFLQMVDGVF
jgi:hypothetical protein